MATATCKDDCLYSPVCRLPFNTSETKVEFAEVCHHFKNKANWFESPCKIGDTAYVVCEDDEGDFISENKVTDVCTRGFFSSAYDPPQDDASFLNPYEEIGETIFFGKGKAEQKLKEIKEKRYEQTKDAESSGQTSAHSYI